MAQCLLRICAGPAVSRPLLQWLEGQTREKTKAFTGVATRKETVYARTFFSRIKQETKWKRMKISRCKIN